jgi:hypothetical protein
MYISISSIYLLLPPLLGVLFYFYIDAAERGHLYTLVLVLLMLMFLEAEKGFALFSTIIYFLIAYRLIIPRLHQYVYCRWCRNLTYVLLAYLGYWLFALLIAQVFWMPLPSFDWHILYYILIESLIVSML